MRVVGYGICGGGEADRYMEATLKEFKRLCDETVICGNNITDKERNLINKYGFKLVEDNREWGKTQWKIKQDLVKNHIAKLNPDMCVCLDMDEVFDPNMTRQDIEELSKSPFDAFYFYIVDLWGDGYSVAHSFWNIRAWRFKPEKGLDFPQKALHCGLAPEWVWHYGYYSPYFVLHYGLKEKKDRQKKVERYAKYDPKAQFIAKTYYDDLAAEIKEDKLDLDKIRIEVQKFVEDTAQKPKKDRIKTQKEVFAFIQKTDGQIIDIPVRSVDDTLKIHPDWVLIGRTDDIESLI